MNTADRSRRIGGDRRLRGMVAAAGSALLPALSASVKTVRAIGAAIRPAGWYSCGRSGQGPPDRARFSFSAGVF